MKVIKQLAKLAGWVCISVLALVGVWIGSWLAMRLATPLFLAPLVLVISAVLGIDNPQDQYRLLSAIRGGAICNCLVVTVFALVWLWRPRGGSADDGEASQAGEVRKRNAP